MIYLTMSVRNMGNGIGVLHGWRVEFSSDLGQADRPSLDGFHRLTRDLYITVGDVTFWQGALRDPSDPEFANLQRLIAGSDHLLIDLLYGDHQGSQRAISRFVLRRRKDGTWSAAVARHWNVDRPDPR